MKTTSKSCQQCSTTFTTTKRSLNGEVTRVPGTLVPLRLFCVKRPFFKDRLLRTNENVFFFPWSTSDPDLPKFFPSYAIGGKKLSRGALLLIEIIKMSHFCMTVMSLARFDHPQEDNNFATRWFAQQKIKSSLYSRYYAEACNEWRGPSLPLRPGQHSSEDTSQR